MSSISLRPPSRLNFSLGIHLWLELDFKEILPLSSHSLLREFFGDLEFEAILEVYFCMYSMVLTTLFFSSLQCNTCGP